MKHQKPKSKNQKAFTLVETLVAISIFSMSVLSIMILLGKGISDSSYAKKRITAAYLAQEGIEYVRNMRDTYVLYHPTSLEEGWENFNSKVAPCNSSGGCYFNNQAVLYSDQSQPMTNLTITACGSSCPALFYHADTGKYDYISSGGVDSGFIRKISVNPISSNETKISSTIFWTQKSGFYQITFSESLFNWVE